MAGVAQENAGVGSDELHRADDESMPRRAETGGATHSQERVCHREPGVG